MLLQQKLRQIHINSENKSNQIKGNKIATAHFICTFVVIISVSQCMAKTQTFWPVITKSNGKNQEQTNRTHEIRENGPMTLVR